MIISEVNYLFNYPANDVRILAITFACEVRFGQRFFRWTRIDEHYAMQLDRNHLELEKILSKSNVVRFDLNRKIKVSVL